MKLKWTQLIFYGRLPWSLTFIFQLILERLNMTLWDMYGKQQVICNPVIPYSNGANLFRFWRLYPSSPLPPPRQCLAPTCHLSNIILYCWRGLAYPYKWERSRGSQKEDERSPLKYSILSALFPPGSYNDPEESESFSTGTKWCNDNMFPTVVSQDKVFCIPFMTRPLIICRDPNI